MLGRSKGSRSRIPAAGLIWFSNAKHLRHSFPHCDPTVIQQARCSSPSEKAVSEGRQRVHLPHAEIQLLSSTSPRTSFTRSGMQRPKCAPTGPCGRARLQILHASDCFHPLSAGTQFVAERRGRMPSSKVHLQAHLQVQLQQVQALTSSPFFEGASINNLALLASNVEAPLAVRVRLVKPSKNL